MFAAFVTKALFDATEWVEAQREALGIMALHLNDVRDNGRQSGSPITDMRITELSRSVLADPDPSYPNFPGHGHCRRRPSGRGCAPTASSNACALCG